MTNFDTRVTSTLGSSTKNFLRAGAGVTAPVLSDSVAHYTSGISESRFSVTTYSHSGLKNMDAQSSSSGSISATKVYDALGNLESSAGNWSSRFGYAGGFGYQEEASGLKLLGHRYYDPSIGRFVTRDPSHYRGGSNLYVYCTSEPVGRRDASGLFMTIGVEGGWQWGNVGTTYGGGVYFSHDDIGFYGEVGGNAGIGAEFHGVIDIGGDTGKIENSWGNSGTVVIGDGPGVGFSGGFDDSGLTGVNISPGVSAGFSAGVSRTHTSYYSVPRFIIPLIKRTFVETGDHVQSTYDYIRDRWPTRMENIFSR